MSFIVKAVKKVFKKVTTFVKRVVRSKWFKIVAIAAVAVFTAGVAAGGFTAFQGVSTVGQFFGAVGQTMANGWTAIANWATGNGFTLDASATAASGDAAAAAAAGGVGSPGTGEVVIETSYAAGPSSGTLPYAEVHGGFAPVAGTDGLGKAVVNAQMVPNSGTGFASVRDLLKAGGTVESTGFWEGSKALASKFLGNFTKDSAMGTFMRNSLALGIYGYYQQKELEKQDEYFRSRTVWGNPAFDGDPHPMDMPTLKERAQDSSIFEQTPLQLAQAERQGQQQQVQGQSIQQAQQPQLVPGAEQVFAGNNLLTPQAPPTGVQNRNAYAQVPQPNQPPPSRGTGLLGVPENLGVNNAV